MIKNNKNEIGSIIRHLATAIGAVCITKGIADADVVAEATGAVTTLAALIWSIVEKKQNKKNGKS